MTVAPTARCGAGDYAGGAAYPPGFGGALGLPPPVTPMGPPPPPPPPEQQQGPLAVYPGMLISDYPGGADGTRPNRHRPPLFIGPAAGARLPRCCQIQRDMIVRGFTNALLGWETDGAGTGAAVGAASWADGGAGGRPAVLDERRAAVLDERRAAVLAAQQAEFVGHEANKLKWVG